MEKSWLHINIYNNHETSLSNPKHENRKNEAFMGMEKSWLHINIYNNHETSLSNPKHENRKNEANKDQASQACKKIASNRQMKWKSK